MCDNNIVIHFVQLSFVTSVKNFGIAAVSPLTWNLNLSLNSFRLISIVHVELSRSPYHTWSERTRLGLYLLNPGAIVQPPFVKGLTESIRYSSQLRGGE